MSKLKIAIQKSGRLNEESLKLLRDCGISIDNGMDRLKADAKNFPLEVYYLRNSDIPNYVEDGIVDIGVVGENLLIEQASNLRVVKQLGFSKCRLSLAVPKEVDFNDVQDLEGKKIATSYPNTLINYLKQNSVTAEIHKISGSVEIAPNIGLADAVCDIVSSGNTLFVNGLKETDVILTSQAVLVARNKLDAAKEQLLDQLTFRIRTVLDAKNTKYILMNVPNDKLNAVTNILPVLKSPTVVPLAQEGWSSVQTVIEENDFWAVIDQLRTAGAEDILVAPIEKIVR